MQDMRGKVKKRLAVFTTHGDSFAEHTPAGVVRRGGVEVGHVTSAVYEPNAQRWTLYALIPTAALPVMTTDTEMAAKAGTGAESSRYQTDLEWEPVLGASLHLCWTR
jgi:glycine cleavage system aminomethyltransferase T